MIINKGKRLWSEDDATCHGDPDHEGLSRAYLRIAGESFDRKLAVVLEDQGDGEWLQTPEGYVVWSSFPGNSEIYATASKEPHA